MLRALIPTLYIAACAATPVTALAGPPLTDKIVGNVKVQLVAAKTSETRGQYLVARFKTVDEPEVREIEVRFPSHSFKTHETTLRNLVHSCTARGRPLPNQPQPLYPANTWIEATVDAFFSIPKDGATSGAAGSLDNCYFLSFQVKPKEK